MTSLNHRSISVTSTAMPAAGLPLDNQGRPVISRHADIVTAANDPDTYSSSVSRYLQVPNGLDGSSHRAARELLDPFFSPGRMAAVAPVIDAVAAEVLADVPFGVEVDAVGDLGAPFAVQAQSCWLGWPVDLEPTLLAWMYDNHEAARLGDPVRMREVAESFDAIITRLISARRGSQPPEDVTTELMRLSASSAATLGDDWLVSILRNWTGGDLGSLALCVGVIAHWLAAHPAHQEDLRTVGDPELDAAIDEILRIDDPFVSNRRMTTRITDIGGCPVGAHQLVVLHWTDANRDPEVFGNPDDFSPETNALNNLVYGTGPHACPGRPLATLELRLFTRALLHRGHLELATGSAPIRELPPLGGYSSVPVVLRARTSPSGKPS
jgi:cytochrome P450